MTQQTPALKWLRRINVTYSIFIFIFSGSASLLSSSLINDNGPPQNRGDRLLQAAVQEGRLLQLQVLSSQSKVAVIVDGTTVSISSLL